MKSTTFDEAEGHFARRSSRAARELDRWLRASNPRKVTWVRHCATRVLYATSVKQIDDVCERSDHPLQNIKKSDVKNIDAATNWHPDFAFQHALHHAAETLGSMPTFGEFAAFCGSDALANEMLVVPAAQARQRAISAGADPNTARQAIRWRIGLAYYSFLREAFAIAVLREAGIDARYHVLPDVLWRVDLWVGDLCVEIYVNNPKFRSHDAGRKTKAADWLSDGPFRFAKLEMARRREYGIAHLPNPDDLVALVRSRL